MLLIPFKRDVFDATLCDRVCQSFSLATPGSSTNKTSQHDITEILLKVALSTITLTIALKTVF